jgi:rhamnosyltransferase subunit B
VITPFAYDQPDNARRLKRLGVAAIVSPSAAPKRWVTAIAGLLADSRVERRCNELAARLKQEGAGAERIADLLVTFAEGPMWQL